MISGRSEEESGHGFARIKEIASGLTVFVIFLLLISLQQSETKGGRPKSRSGFGGSKK